MGLLKAMTTVSIWTLASRVLGLVRDILLAYFLGVGFVMEAFAVAFRLPNMFRRIFAEGALSSAFVPQYSRVLENQGQDKADAYARQVLTLLSGAIICLSVLAVVFMPVVIDWLAGAFRTVPGKYELTLLMARIMFAYLLFMAIMALLAGMLNTHGRFAAAAAAPLMLNLVLTVGMVVLLPYVQAQGPALAWLVIAGGLCQVAVVWVAVRRAGLNIGLTLAPFGQRAGKTFMLMIPGTLAAGAQQINLLLSTFYASQVAGANSFFHFADRLYQLPVGLIAVAFGVVVLPNLSRLIRSGQTQRANAMLNRGLELGFLLSLPATAALLVIPLPLVVALFESGQFDRSASVATAWAVAVYALGLPAFVMTKILAPGFFARENTRTPMIYALVSVATNILLMIILFPPPVLYWPGFGGVYCCLGQCVVAMDQSDATGTL